MTLLKEYQPEIVTAVLSIISGVLLTSALPAAGRIVKNGFVFAIDRISNGEYAYRKYRSNLAFDMRQLKLLRMMSPRDLEQVFVPLRVQSLADSDDHDFTASRQASYSSLEQALAKHARIVILGEPGAGKTSLTKHATQLLAERRLRIADKYYVPIYIALNEAKFFFNGEHGNEAADEFAGEDLLARTLAAYGFEKAHSFIVRKLRRGRCFIVFDGFDELANDHWQEVAAAMIRRLARNYSRNNRIVVTSRSAGFRSPLFSAFDTLQIVDMSAEQADSFIQRWFLHSEEKASRLAEILRNNRRLQAIATNPLMLAVICITYDIRGDLPQRKADLYSYCIDTLLEFWDSSRGVDRSPVFDTSEKLKVLKHFAFDLHAARRADFTDRIFMTAVRRHLHAAGIKAYQDREFIDEVIEHTGIIAAKGAGLVFQHLTFQEYLAAENLVDQGSSGLGYLVNHVDDPWWAEVIILAAGIQRNATELLEQIYRKYGGEMSNQTCLLLGRCLMDADLSDFAIQDEIMMNIIDLAYPARTYPAGVRS
jgi:predicted NACHT family NTPase